MKTSHPLKKMLTTAFTAIVVTSALTVGLNQSVYAGADPETATASIGTVNNNSAVGEDDYIGTTTVKDGTITVSGSSTSAAIWNFRYSEMTEVSNVIINSTTNTTRYGIINDSYSTIDKISDVSITLESDVTSYAYGISNTNNSSIGSITNATIDVTNTNTNGYATGYYDQHLGGSTEESANFSGSITASGTINSYALQLGTMTAWSKGSFHFNGDTELIATGGSSANDAIWVGLLSSVTFTAESSSTSIKMTGDIYSAGGIKLDSGSYVLTSESVITTTKYEYADYVGYGQSFLIENGASLTLQDDTSFNLSDSTLTFNIYGAVENYIFTTEEGVSIYGLENIEVYLDEANYELWLKDGNNINIIDCTTAAAIAEAECDITVYCLDANGDLDETFYDVSSYQLSPCTEPIPEPSTATLSLLALAGLCARRRRKAA